MKRYPVSRSLDKPIYEPQPYRANGAIQKSGGRAKQTHLRIVSNYLTQSANCWLSISDEILTLSSATVAFCWAPDLTHHQEPVFGFEDPSSAIRQLQKPQTQKSRERDTASGFFVAEVTCLRTSAEDNPAPSTINHAALHFFRILQHLYGKEFPPLSRSPLHLSLKAQNKTKRTSHSFPKQHVRKSKQKQQFHFGILWYGWILPSNRAFATVQRSSTAMQSPGRGSFCIPYPPVI